MGLDGHVPVQLLNMNNKYYPPRLQKDQDILIDQSNILLKKSEGQVVPCQLTQSGYATGSYDVQCSAE